MVRVTKSVSARRRASSISSYRTHTCVYFLLALCLLTFPSHPLFSSFSLRSVYMNEYKGLRSSRLPASSTLLFVAYIFSRDSVEMAFFPPFMRREPYIPRFLGRPFLPFAFQVRITSHFFSHSDKMFLPSLFSINHSRKVQT